MSNFRNFKNRVHTLKWWLFSDKRYTCYVKTAIICSIPVVYLSVTTESYLMLEKNNYLLKESEKTPVRWIKHGEKKLTHDFGTWKFADKIGREPILIILMFSLIFRSSLSSSNVGDSLLRLVSVLLLSTPTSWNFEISMTSWHLLNSVYVGNTGETTVYFLPWLFCRLLLIF